MIPRIFQECSAKRIAQQLGSGHTHRFLLADEVGLGKTVVMQDVINRMRRRGVIIYVCPSLDIAEQNKDRLIPAGSDASLIPVDRLSLFPTIRLNRKGTSILALTPGTSLHQRGAGNWKERRLLWQVISQKMQWSRPGDKVALFKGNAGADHFTPQHVPQSSAVKEFKRLLDSTFRQRITEAAEEATPHVGPPPRGMRARHRKLIAELRELMAMTVLRTLRPSLILADEFQNYTDDIFIPKDNSLAYALFQRGTAPILLVSATPFKPYTTRDEDSRGHAHSDKLEELLSYLAWPKESPSLNFDEFKKEILKDKLDAAKILSLREEMERQLKLLLCRTERGPFQRVTPDARNSGFVPGKEELEDFFSLSSLSSKAGIPPIPITLWRSGSYILSFGDHYQRVKPLLKGSVTSKEARTLFVPPRRTSKVRILPRSRKLAALIESHVEKHESFAQLWLPPLIHYDKSKPLESPGKVLVFSSWRFVPRLISAIASQHADTLLEKSTPTPPRSPLGLKSRKVSAFFYPSMFLAQAIHPSRGEPTNHSAVETRLRGRLKAIGLSQGSANCSLFDLLIALDRKILGDDLLREAWVGARLKSDDDGLFNVLKHDVLDSDASPQSYSSGQLSTLAALCTGGPAVLLTRACLLIGGEKALSDPAAYAAVIKTAFGGLRNFFSRSNSHRCISYELRRDRRHYTDKILRYCEKFHFQEVLDEYLYLVHLQEPAIPLMLKALSTSLTIKVGAITAKTRKDRRTVDRKFTTHFAAGFGDISGDEKDASRKSALRIAFNSPFAPFILATTMVGQEGLDFHLYCANILHWNLPSSPVSLEQREGRIDRFNSLAVRKGVAKHPYKPTNIHPWESLFAAATRRFPAFNKSTGGLFPNWIGRGKEAMISRSVRPYTLSREAGRYQRLLKDLALYRLALGQPDQEGLLAALRAKGSRAGNVLKKYFLNLSPLSERISESQRDSHPSSEASRTMIHGENLNKPNPAS